MGKKAEWGDEPKKVTSYQAGSTFGELALLHGDMRAATVTATTDCQLWRLGQDTFKRIMMQSGNKKLSEHEKFLENVEILSTLTKYERFRLAESLKSTTYSAGDVIIKEGEPGDDFFIIEQGSVTCTKRVM